MKIPKINSRNLFYESGVHIGDGSMMSDKSYNSVVSYWGDARKDHKYFNDVLIPLLNKLYGLKPRINRFENTLCLRIYNKDLVYFKSKRLKLPLEQKSKLKFIPKIFLSKKKHIFYLISGIFDTDGTVKIIKRKDKVYPRLRITLNNKGIDVSGNDNHGNLINGAKWFP
ncbi:MAG TPA: hypothetical protein VJG30_01850 [Candidatus Nanoarchaeia archaeon]|nr:hypothetical protein [Candidatus Nanoarchaeia archaeon]